MKKLIILALALITFQANAQRDQDKKDRRQDRHHDRTERLDDFTPQQIATLKTKQMTLALDLSESQQKKIQDFNFEEATFRKTKMEERKEGERKKPTKEERFEMMNSKLDHQIKQKQTLKKILTEDQFEKFEASKKKHKKNNKKQNGKKGKKRERKHDRD